MSNVFSKTEESKILQLQLSNNGLEGTIPSEIKLLSNLQSVRLQRNNLEAFFDWSDEGEESVDDNDNDGSGRVLDDVDVPFLADWDQFVDIDLSENRFRGTIPSFLFQLSSLIKMKLSSNQWSNNDGNDPMQLDKLTNLQELYISNNPSLQGTIPTSIGLLSSLQTFGCRRAGWKATGISQRSSGMPRAFAR